ncbi:MAG TPA: 50S ribosomal protein L18 [Candidatus Korarchaeota archaeon]|nr:50S ribosomal protein L18 [Candidatus Korarchaeota archaeon]
MARSARYKVKFRRRREGKTDYWKRLALLKSGKIRMVVRRSNRFITVQFVRSKLEGDEVVTYAYSKEIQKFGWPFSCKNIPAAYLTGYIAGIRAIKAGIKEAILDIGRYPSTKGSRLYAALKGALDAGLLIPHSDEILPEQERIEGRHIAEWALSLREENEELYRKIFSEYQQRNVKPEEISETFKLVLDRIKEEVVESETKAQEGGS